jgi:hypothetical protein
MAVYPYRRGDTDYPNRGNWNGTEELAAAVADGLRYPPRDGLAWTAHDMAVYIREHGNVNGIRPDSFDGWDIERIVAGLVAEGKARYLEGGD